MSSEPRDQYLTVCDELQRVVAERDQLRAELAVAERDPPGWRKHVVESMDAASLAAGVGCCDQIPGAIAALRSELAVARADKDQAYLERNRLVALLSKLFPAGTARTAIDGWSEDWHGCVYIDFPWGQASWHYHDSQAYLFAHLPPYSGSWDGHTTEQKYAAIDTAIAERQT